MEISTLQTLAQPYIHHQGLASLPTEILAHIRTCLRDLDEPNHDEPDRYDYCPNTSLPLVCRRFRHLELSIPSLWTLLTDGMTIDQINLHVARSGALGLKVQLFLHDRTGCLCEKWRLLAQSSHRWSILALCAFEQQHNCFRSLRGLSLPSLWNLNISSDEEDVIPVLSTWTIPSVRAVNFSELSALLALPLMQALTTLRLDHDLVADDRLLDFIASEPQLTSLQLTLCSLNIEGGLPMQYKKLTLPMLCHFSLEWPVGTPVYEQTVFQLMRCIAMPNIRFVNLVLTKHVADNDTFIDWLPSLKNPSLHTVTVHVYRDSDGTSQGRIVNALQGNDGIFRVEASIDRTFVTRTWKISFTRRIDNFNKSLSNN